MNLTLALALALLQDGTLTLEPRGAENAKLPYYPIRIDLQAARPAAVVKEPAYRAIPRYGILRVGNGPRSEFVLAVDEPGTGDYKVFIDRNRNGDLSDDGDGGWNGKSTKAGNRVMYGVLEVLLRASYGTATEEASSSDCVLALYRFVDQPGNLLMYRRSCRKGSVSIDGRSYRAILAENDGDAVYSKRYSSAEEAGGTHPLWLKLDTAGDGSYAVTLDIRTPFAFGGKRYEAIANADGSRLDIRPTDKPPVDLDLFRRVNTKKAQGDLAGALAELTTAIELDPKRAALYDSRGAIRMLQKDYDGAIADWTRIIDLDPRNADAYSQRAMARKLRKDAEGAIADYTKVLDLVPRSSSALQNRAYLHFDRRSWAEALADFRRRCEIDPAQQDYDRFRIWIIRSRQGERKAADRELTDYLSARKTGKPGDWPSKIMGFLVGTLPEAAFLAAAKDAEATLTREQECEAYYYAGSVRSLDGNKAGAAEYFQKCLDTKVSSFYEYDSAAAELEALKKGG